MMVSLLEGEKHSILGAQEVIYGKNQTMISGLDMPCTTQVTGASPAKPYFALILELDSQIIKDLLKELKDIGNRELDCKSVAITDFDPYLMEAFSRLIDLLSYPEEQQKVLAPLILREIHYRLLTGPLGGLLKKIHTLGTEGNQVAQVIDWIKDNYNESFKIQGLAEKVNMSPATFYRNFKKVTSLSPIQYQKRLRLCEAQDLLLTGRTVSSVVYQVGYKSPTQFNKEYKKMFGNPPRRDIQNRQAF
jgi:AraC-like DNA-binding protein